MATCYQLPALSDALATQSSREEGLQRALQRGDAEALRDVYRAHHEQVRAFARRLLGSDADAEEVVQEVFVALPRAIARFRGDATLATFIMGVAVNHARHYLRAAGRRRALHARFASEAPRSASEATDEALLREQLAERLLQAMSRLNEDQRLAFVLCDVEERSSAEVARILDVPASTVRSRLAAARESLRALLQEAAR
jgi:RNA polymerase sigma-70 factor, ECF subfamily